VNDVTAVVAEVFAARSDATWVFLGELEFVAMPAPNDRLMMPTGSPDGSNPYKVLFVEHHPRPFPRSDQTGPARAIVVVELL